MGTAVQLPWEARGEQAKRNLEDKALAPAVEDGLAIAVRTRHREGEGRSAVIEQVVCRCRI